MHVPNVQQLEDLIRDIVREPQYSGPSKTLIDRKDFDTLAMRLVVFNKEPHLRRGRTLEVFERETLAELMTVALITVASKHIFPNDANQVFAGRLLELIGSLNRCRFQTSVLWPQIYSIAADVSVYADEPIDFLIDFINGWIIDELTATRVKEAESPIDTERIQADVHTCLTNVPEPRLYQLERVSDQVAEVFSEHELRIATYQPIAHTHPLRHPKAAHDPIFVHGLDSTHIAASDAVVAVLDQPSVGVGIALAYAERARALLLILVSGAVGRSPLLLGLGCRKSIYITDFNTDVRPLVRHFLSENAAELEAHRNLRHNRIEFYQGDLAECREALRLQGTAVVSQRLPAFLDMTRLKEILQSPDFFATQTLEERRIVSRSLRLRSRAGAVASTRREALSDPELEALQEYAVLRDLSGEAVIGLQRRAQRVLASQGARRLRLSNADDWYKFDSVSE